jgi:hypothetical protein
MLAIRIRKKINLYKKDLNLFCSLFEDRIKKLKMLAIRIIKIINLYKKDLRTSFAVCLRTE